MILVVGGAGFIGSHMCLRLRAEGVEHLVLDNLEKGHRAAIAGSPLVQADLREPASLQRVFQENRIDAVINFAAYIEVGESAREPGRYWANNVGGVLNLLEAMRQADCRKIIFSSTAAVYGEPETPLLSESHPKRPASPYGATKLAAEMLIDSYDFAHDFRSVCLRYFNAAGADPDGRIGEDHEPETHLIPRILLAAAGRTDGISIFGRDYDTPDGTCIRDYVHVMDLVEAHWLALHHLLEGGESRRYNLGYGRGSSVQEVVDACRKVTGNDFEIREADRRPGDPARLVADSSAIQNEWGWSPQFDDLETIIGHAWQWMQANPMGYNDRA